MKKKFAAILLSALTVCALTGCGGEKKEASAPATAAPKAPVSLTLGTGGTGGTYYALGGAMANTWSNDLKNIKISAVSTGASVENMNLLNSGEADLGIAMNSIADDCFKGKGAFEKSGAKKNFATIGVVYPEVLQIVSSEKIGAKSLADLKGKKVAIGPVGSGTASASGIVFGSAGIDVAKDIQAQRDSFGNATSKMQDGHIDASFAVLAVPASAITELQTAMPISFVNVSDAELGNIQKDFPYYTRFTIPAGTYSNKEDVQTVTCQAALYCRNDLDEDTVYQITKSFYENGDKVAATHAAGKYIKLATALDGITTPIHPGAAKYYKEKGLTVPEIK